MEILIRHGWILKRMERHFCVYPLYNKFSGGNIPDSTQGCEEICRQSGMGCVFRIVEHTNIPLKRNLHGYRICTMAEGNTVIGIKRQGLLFLPDGNWTEKYKQAGFNRIYRYRCYQKEKKFSKGQED